MFPLLTTGPLQPGEPLSIGIELGDEVVTHYRGVERRFRVSEVVPDLADPHRVTFLCEPEDAQPA